MIVIISMLYYVVVSLWAIPVLIYGVIKLVDGDKLLDVLWDCAGITACIFVVEAVLGYILALNGYTFPIQ